MLSSVKGGPTSYLSEKLQTEGSFAGWRGFRCLDLSDASERGLFGALEESGGRGEGKFDHSI